MAECVGLEAIRPEMPRDLSLDPAAIEVALRADTGQKIKAFLAVHNENATGIVSEMALIRQAIDAAGHPALFVVVAISSLAIEPVAMDNWGASTARSPPRRRG